MIPMTTNGKIDINALGVLINRKPHTIRGWERDGSLPKQLRGTKDSRGRRWWNQEQVDGIRDWMVDRYPGSGLPGYKPTHAEAEEHVKHLQESKAVA
jgi:hypothetical protein